MADDDSTTGKSPAFQFYPKDYLSDARTRAMTFKQRGMYWDLISYTWLEGALPHEPAEIARILGITTAARFCANDWPVLSRCFRFAEDIGWIHPRLEAERTKQADFRRRQSDHGKHGGRPRKPKPSQDESQEKPSLSKTKANESSAISDLQSSDSSHKEHARVIEMPERPKPSDDLALRAGTFVQETYPTLYAKFRNGARYVGKPHLDFQEALELCRVWDDDRLAKLATAFLTTDHDFAERGSRTVAQFRSMASWCDSQLREAGI